jgi:hypothetical protein
MAERAGESGRDVTVRPEDIRAQMASTRTALERKLRALKKRVSETLDPFTSKGTIMPTRAKKTSKSSRNAKKPGGRKKTGAKRSSASRTTGTKTRKKSSTRKSAAKKRSRGRSVTAKAKKVLSEVLTGAAAGAATGAMAGAVKAAAPAVGAPTPPEETGERGASSGEKSEE